jgi:hypothetical protein
MNSGCVVKQIAEHQGSTTDGTLRIGTHTTNLPHLQPHTQPRCHASTGSMLRDLTTLACWAHLPMVEAGNSGGHLEV